MAVPPASPASAATHERISQGDLDQVIKQHEMFFDKRPGGKRAQLGKRDLSGLRMARRDLREIDLSGAILVGCDLSESNLQNAVLFGANLGKAKLIGSQLERADLRGAGLEAADLTSANLTDADIGVGRIAERVAGGELKDVAAEEGGQAPGDSDRANFTAANLTNARFNGANIRAAIFDKARVVGTEFRNTKLNGATFAAATIEDADFTDAELDGGELSGAAIKSIIGRSCHELHPSLDERLAAHQQWIDSGGRAGARLDLVGVDLRTGPSLAGRNFCAARLSRVIATGVDFENAMFLYCDFTQADLRSARFSGADLRGCILNAARLDNADLRDTKIGGLPLVSGGLLTAKIRKASLRNADLRNADLRGQIFTDCDLTAISCVDAEMEGSNISNIMNASEKGRAG
ncbi:MAG: pentapeptide repeat-containing protein [Alphaproteobacteria bacterium]